MDSEEPSKTTFMKHVFNFNDESKAQILNILQYVFVSLIPVIILNKSISHYVPDADESKSSIELSAELIIQVILMFLGLILIDRIVTFVPTYSKQKYDTHSLLSIILPILMITLTIQSKLSDKVNILIERLSDHWNGTDNKKKKPSKSGSSNKSNPNAVTSTGATSSGGVANNYTDGTSINSLPTQDMTSNNNQNMLSPQQLPNYNNMYRNDNTPLVGASAPGDTSGQEGYMEPMAANSVLGASLGASW